MTIRDRLGLLLAGACVAVLAWNGVARAADAADVSQPVPGPKDLTAYAEFYSQVTPARDEDDQYAFDAALAYQVEPSTQLDLGANFGLNRGAPDTQVYSGVAHRF